MKSFAPLSDRTAQVQNYENIAVNQRKVVAALPSYSSTMYGGVYSPTQRCAPLAPAAVVSVRVNDPYGFNVLSPVQCPASPVTHGPRRSPAETPLVQPCLDVSNESAVSSAGGAAPAVTQLVATTVVKTPIRRVYRNGRPVPVFASSDSMATQSSFDDADACA